MVVAGLSPDTAQRPMPRDFLQLDCLQPHLTRVRAAVAQQADAISKQQKAIQTHMAGLLHTVGNNPLAAELQRLQDLRHEETRLAMWNQFETLHKDLQTVLLSLVLQPLTLEQLKPMLGTLVQLPPNLQHVIAQPPECQAYWT
jgi:hypothetical protein